MPSSSVYSRDHPVGVFGITSSREMSSERSWGVSGFDVVSEDVVADVLFVGLSLAEFELG
jgi:hypothetical protein